MMFIKYKPNLETLILFFLMLAVAFQRLPISGGNHLYVLSVILFIYWCYKNKVNVINRLKERGAKAVMTAYALFTLCFVPSIICSDSISYSFQDYFNYFVGPFFPFVIIMVVVNDKIKMERLWICNLLFICADAGLALYQFLILHISNGYGFGNQYLSLSGYLACFIPVALVWALDKDFSKLLRYCAAVVVVIMLICAFVASRSRALWCILIALVPFILLCYRNNLLKHKAVLVASLVGVLLVGGFFFSSEKNMQRLKSFSNTTTNGSNLERLWMWHSAHLMMKDFPVTGVGVGNYTHYYQKVYETKGIGHKGYGHPHSSYLLVGAEAGLPGFLAIVISTLAILFTNLRKWLSTKDVYAYLLFVNWLGFSIFGLIEPLIIYQQHTMLMGYFSGCFLVCRYLRNIEKE